MTPKDRQFDEEFGAGFRALRQSRGECLTAESLTAFLEGSLSSAEQDSIRQHVDVCGLCDGLLVRMRDFDAPVPSGEPPGWPAIEQRIRARVFPPKRTWWSRLREVAWHPAFAYAFGVAMSAIVFVAQRPGRVPEFGGGAGQSVNLIEIRSLDVTTPEKFVVLQFWLPIRPGVQYTATLDNLTTKDIVSEDRIGNFSVAYKRQELPAGKHTLTITGTDPRTGKKEQSGVFPFKL